MKVNWTRILVGRMASGVLSGGSGSGIPGKAVSPEQARFLKGGAGRAPGCGGFRSECARGLGRAVYPGSLAAIDRDSNPEARCLRQSAQDPGLDAKRVNAIHEQVGAPLLYARRLSVDTKNAPIMGRFF